MKLFLLAVRLPVLCMAFALGIAFVAAAQSNSDVQIGNVVRALGRDLQAIPAGSPPTDAQKQTLSTDLGRLFREVNFPPTNTLDYVAGKLANVAAQGRLSSDTLALEVTDLAISSPLHNNAKVAALEASLVNAGIAQADAQQLVAGVRALPYSKISFTEGNSRNARPLPLDPTAPNYRHTQLSTIELDTDIGPETAQGAVTDPSHFSQALTVELSQVPLGKYLVSVTTVSTGQTVNIGTVRVRPGPLIYDPDKIYHDPRFCNASFGDFYLGRKPLPDGLAVDDIATVTLADRDGVVRLRADFTNPARLAVTHSAQGHLTPTAAAPTAGGSISAVVGRDGLLQTGSLLFSAVGLPANATLMISANGAAVGPVMTGPTGNLYVRTSQGVFPRPPKSGEIVNLFPDTVDLFTLTSFAVSDAQGKLLLGTGAPQ